MPIVVPILSAALAIGAVAGAAVTSQNWSQQRSAALYAEIDSDIEKTLRQHDHRKDELSGRAPSAPSPATAAMSSDVAESPAGAVTPSAGGTDAKNDAKARKAKIGSLKKRAAGHRRERFVPPDFARLPVSIMRSAFGALR